MPVRFLILSFGVFCAATSVVMTKISTLAPELLSAYRLFVAGLALLPLFLRDKKRNPQFRYGEAFRISSLPALVLALHFISWTIGARLTTSVNSTLIVNLIPAAMPFLAFFITKEMLNQREWIGTALALLGVTILGISDYRASQDLLFGDLICLISMLLMALYLILARKNRSVPTIWLYVVPLYLIAGGLCLGVGFLRTGIPETVDSKEYLWGLLLGLVPTIFGHSLLNLSMQWFRSQLVAIANQMQFVYAGVLGYFFFSEIPQSSFYLASICMLVGAIWTLPPHGQTRL